MPNDGMIIDLCAGGGELSKKLLERPDFRGMVVISDISRKMLSLSSKILKPKYSGRYFAVVCDAENLPFRDSIFSGAISAFCLRNLTNLDIFTSEVSRVSNAGATVFHLEIAHPRSKILAALFEFYFYKLSPMIARLFTFKAYAYKYLPNSLRIFPLQDDVVKVLGRGWNEASYANIMGGIASIYRLKKGAK
jgi:demethylmenaquinone methyltransferase/2-methoxy-6-polyprenyl-1,4-benzoquinol methylase